MKSNYLNLKSKYILNVNYGGILIPNDSSNNLLNNSLYNAFIRLVDIIQNKFGINLNIPDNLNQLIDLVNYYIINDLIFRQDLKDYMEEQINNQESRIRTLTNNINEFNVDSFFHENCFVTYQNEIFIIYQLWLELLTTSPVPN